MPICAGMISRHNASVLIVTGYEGEREMRKAIIGVGLAAFVAATAAAQAPAGMVGVPRQHLWPRFEVVI